ncbi:hypothetical protein K2P56_03940 [Patescibacteria group bacterium]|nr:hypothetical protein [Patescibacteria group bacterium]
MSKSKEGAKVTPREQKPKKVSEPVVYRDSMMYDTPWKRNFHGEVVGFWRD